MIPQLLLEEINLGEKRAEDYYDKYGKEELEAALNELKKSDEEILLKYPFKTISNKVSANLNEDSAAENTKTNVKVVDFTKFRRIGFAAAAALAVLVSAPVVIRSLNSDAAQNDSIRLKGAESKQTLKLYKQDGGSAVLLNNGAKVKSGDVIQISYVAGKNQYGIIFSIDGDGNITKHFPDATWKAAKLNKNMTEVPLDFSYELDDAPNYECFVFVTGDKPFVLDELSMIDSKDVKLDIIKSSQYVPKTCVKSIFMLKK